MTKDKEPQSIRTQKAMEEILPHFADDLIELAQLAEVVTNGAKELRLRNREKLLGITVQVDKIEGASGRMIIMINGLMKIMVRDVNQNGANLTAKIKI